MALKLFTGLKKEVSVKNMIHQRLAGWEEARPHGVIHASDLLKELEFCPREWAFLDLGAAKKKDSFVGTALRMTFDHGRSMEHNLRNNWLRDAAVGHWKCQVCGHVHEHFGPAPKVKCSKCGWAKWEYEEPRIESPSSGISGGIDVLLNVGLPKLRIVEIKSMDKDEFKKLAAPLAEHKFRTALYLRLAHESKQNLSNLVNTQEATILYVSKAFGIKDDSLALSGIKDSPFSPLKEFVVKRDDAMTATPVAKAKVLTYWRNLPEQQGLPCGVCQSGLSKRAQQCSAVGPCFSGNYPSVFTWPEGGAPRHPGKKLIE